MTSDFDISEDRFKRMKAFTMHGASLHELTGTQVRGDCPFCLKEGHFYANWEKLLWDCKVCGATGNVQTFLEKINERNKKRISAKEKAALAADRGLPLEALDHLELGFFSGQYTMAVRTALGKLTDLRIYRIGGKAMSTAGVQTGLLGLPEMAKDRGGRVFVCEGEWDTVAMQWLLKAAREPGRAVCSPGATTFKPEWAELFQGRETTVMYDNDAAGIKGELVVLDRLAKKAKALKFVHWPTGLPNGFDVRDFVLKHAIPKKTPKGCFKKLMDLVKDRPRTSLDAKTEEMLDGRKTPEIDPSVTIEDVFRAYEEIYHEPNRMGIEMAIIILLSNVFNTDPIWMFLVAPPSTGKTAIINGFKYLNPPYDQMALYCSHVTTHSLISGMETKRGDPSIFATLNGEKMSLFIKDFTPVLAMRESDKQDVCAQFRDAYDGYTSKSFGNGIKREYDNLKFGVLAGVTDAIYDESDTFQALGERFGKLSISRNGDTAFNEKAMHMAMDKRDDFKEQEDRIARMVYSCVKNLAKKAEESGLRLPKLDMGVMEAVVGVSSYVSIMRGVVSRDPYRRDYIKSSPYSETGIRFCKMMGAIVAVRAFIYGRQTVSIEDLPIIRKVAMDTINQRDEEILRKVYLLSKKDSVDEPLKHIIQQGMKYPPYTVHCVLENLYMLDILAKEKIGRKFHYKLTDRMKRIVERAKMYQDPIELARENHKVRLKRNKVGQGAFTSKKRLFISPTND